MAELNVLLTSSGRRVELLGLLRDAVAHEAGRGRIVAADAATTSPAASLADASVRLPRADHREYPEALRAVIAAHGIGLIVPTIDTELPVLSNLRADLSAAGTHSLVSGSETVAIARDKFRTHAHLMAQGLPAPRQWTGAAALRSIDHLPFPVVVKPATGSASEGVRVVDDAARLRAGLAEDEIVQERLVGPEYTVDVWVDGGHVVSAVPRRRLEVRAGEVSKAVTTGDLGVVDLAVAVAEGLPDPDGPLTVQVICGDAGPAVIEINARLGGGYPLSVAAGAPTLRWAVQRALGRPRAPEEFRWETGVLMLRYDQSVIVRGWDGSE